MKTVFTALLLLCMAFSAKAQYVHPGAFDTKESLDRMKEKVLAKESPWIDGWTKLLEERDSRSDFNASPKSSVAGASGVRQRASRDAMAAYYNLIRWYVTGDTTHAECAVKILNDWSNAVNAVVTGELFQLPIVDFMNAAELARTYKGWKADDFERFKKMARDYFYPACHDFCQKGENWPGWGGPANTGIMLIGVFLDDEDMVNEAIDNFKNGISGDCITRGLLKANGQPVEMGRDQPHAEIGLTAYANVCQVAWNQGIDLFSYEDNLLLRGYEYFCKYNLGHEVDWTPVNYQDHIFWFPAHGNSAPGSLPQNRIYGDIQSFQMAYHHYADRIGLAMPYTRAMLNLQSPSNMRGMLYNYTDTCTAYADKPAPTAPTNLVATGGVGYIRLDWDIPEGDCTNGFIVQRTAIRGGSYTTLTETTDNVTNWYEDTDVAAGKTYYYRVCARNASGKSAYAKSVNATVAEVTEGCPDGWTRCDLGDVTKAGTTTWSEVNGNTLILNGYGVDLWNAKHAIGNFTYAQPTGDFDLRCRLHECEQNASQIKVKVGVMAREDLNTDAKSVILYMGDTGVRQSVFLWRTAKGGGTSHVAGDDHLWKPLWFRLVRKGNVFEAFISDYGDTWHSLGTATVSLSKKCYAGLFVCSGAYLDDGFTAEFDHVSIENETLTGIDDVETAGGASATATVYNLQGIAVGTLSANESLRDIGLSKGIYLIGQGKGKARGVEKVAVN